MENGKTLPSGSSILDKLIAKDAETIQLVFFSPSIYRRRLDLAIRQMLQVNSDYNTVFIKHYFHTLLKAGCKRLKMMKKHIAELSFEQILQDDFLFYLARRRHLRTDCRTVDELLSHDDNVIEEYLWSKGDKYDEVIKEEADKIQRYYGISLDTEELKRKLHDYLSQNPRKLLMKFDFITSFEKWCEDMVHHFIEGKPRVDLIVSHHHSLIDIFLRKECNNEKICLEKIVNSFHINGRHFITYDDFVQTFCEKIVKTGYKDFMKFNYECSIFVYIMKIARNFLLDLKSKEEKRLGLHPTTRTKKEKREEQYQIKAQELETTTKLLLKALSIPGSKEYFGIEKEDDTLEVMMYIMEEIHIKCSTNEEKRERRKVLRSEFGKSKGYINLLEFRAKDMVSKIQHKLLTMLKERNKRELSHIEIQLYHTIIEPTDIKYEV